MTTDTFSARPYVWANRFRDGKAAEQLSDHDMEIVMNACHWKPEHRGDVLKRSLQDRVNPGDAMVLGLPDWREPGWLETPLRNTWSQARACGQVAMTTS